MSLRPSAFVLLVFFGAALPASAAAPAGAADDPPPRHAVSLHLLHPVATSPDPATRTGVRLSLLWGRSAAVTALDGGLVATGTDGDVRGAQIVGAYAGVDGDLAGFGFTWGVHRVGGDVRGLQFASGAAWTTGAVRGVQYGTLLGYAGGGLRGVQISTLVTLNDRDGRWAQLGTVANVNAGGFAGAQLSSAFNFTGAELRGGQLATLNVAGRLRGVQVGAFNVAGDASGLQLGLVNVAREHHGVPVGLVNLADNGRVDLLAYATNVALANLAVRTVVGPWRSTLTAGWYEVDAVETSTGALAWHFGRRLWGDARRSLGVDVGLVHLIPEDAGEAGAPRLHPSWQVRLTGEVMLGERWGLHGAVGLETTGEAYEEDAPTEDGVLLAGGVVWR
jgi:hypothetical protein